MSKKRPDWDTYFLKMALLVAERATCHRHHMGAVIVRDKRLLTTGYNGAPSGEEDCLEIGYCEKDRLGLASGVGQEKCKAIHAEQNAIIQAGLHGIKIAGGTMYCTHNPCYVCAKSIANAGLVKVISCAEYPDEDYIQLFSRRKIAFITLELPDLTISYKP